MPLFSRKNKTEEIAKAVAAELAKNVGPYSAGTYSQATAAAPYTNSNMDGQIQIAGEAVPMPRPASAFGAILGPAAPMLPAPLDEVLDDSGRAMPRKYEAPVASNLNITQTAVPYAVLKALSEQCDIIHRCIEIRVSELTKMDWSFSLDSKAIQQIMEEDNVSHAKAAKIGREKYGEEIVRLTEFWENPYVATDRSFKEWLTEALWQSFVYDQLCIYPRYSLGKKLIGLDVIDAPTIKILLDNRGDIPHPPAPAFQQILFGFPRGEFTASPDTDVNGTYYNGVGRAGQFITDQMFVSVKNRRTWSPYGFSPVEMAIPAATLYLERQRWMRAEYTEGTAPKTWMKTSSKEVLLDPLKLAAYERVLNDRLAGSTSERHRVKVLPDGFDPVQMASEDEKYRSDYDEFIIKRIASIFGVAPSALGVVPRSGLGGAGEHKGERESVDAISAKPMENYVVEFINSLSRRFLGADKNITFVLDNQDNAQNEAEKTKAYQVALSSGQMTLNDVRGELGMPLYDDPAADEPFLTTPQGPVYFRGTLNTDSTGDTTSQVGEPDGTSPQSPQSPQGQEVDQEPQAPQEPSDGKGEAPQDHLVDQKSVLVEEELEAFAKFVRARIKKGGAYRDFNFVTISEDDAYALNQDAQAILKGDTYTPPKGVQEAAQRALDWIKDDKAGSGFTAVGRKRASDLARGAGVSMTTLRRMKAYFDRHQSDKTATGFKAGEDGYPSPGRVAWDAWGGDAGYSWVKGLVGEQKSEMTDTPKGLLVTKGQRELHELPGHDDRQSVVEKHRASITAGIAASVRGWKKAVEQALASAPKQGADKTALQAIANQAIQHNVVGDATQLSGTLTNLTQDAAQVSGKYLRVPLQKQGKRLQEILSQADQTANAIQGTTLNRLQGIIVNGMEQGQSSKQIADQINLLINDPARADLIAVTETNSSYNAAFIDSLEASGQTQWWWEAYVGACEICVGMVGWHDLGDPHPDDGSHPNCRCTVLDQQP